MNHPLPWVELLVHRNTTYGSRWILQVQPTTRDPENFSRACAQEEFRLVELLVSENTTYGSRWMLQVQPTTRDPEDFSRDSAPEEIQTSTFLLGSMPPLYLRRAARDDH